MRDARAAHGLPTEIKRVPNPRTELEHHYYNARHQRLLDLGLEPHELANTLIDSVIGIVERSRRRIRPELFPPRVDWRRGGPGLRPRSADRLTEAALSRSRVRTGTPAVRLR